MDKEYSKQQHCPACNRYVKYSSRYPNYACDKCVALAQDKNGRALCFLNTEISGHGCEVRYVDDHQKKRNNTCYIKGIKFKAEEAYFGGIVMLPLLDTYAKKG